MYLPWVLFYKEYLKRSVKIFDQIIKKEKQEPFQAMLI